MLRRSTHKPACHDEWPCGRFQTFQAASTRVDKGVYPWHLHAISVANVVNPAITSVMPTIRPSGSSSPTSNQSGHSSTDSLNAFGCAHAVSVAAKFKKPFSRLLKKSLFLLSESLPPALRNRPQDATTLIGQFHGKPIVRRERQFPTPIAARQHQTHLTILIKP